jgi:cation-transporting ATPase E
VWPTGLRSEQVEARRRRGEVNTVPSVTSRSVASILVSNIFTRFNVLLGLLLVAILAIGPIQDALFGLVLIVNTPIGIVQELRGKRALDRLAVLTAPTAHVIRNGVEQQIPVAELVVSSTLYSAE